MGNNQEEIKEAKWYILHVRTGEEDKVKFTIEKLISAPEFKDRILEVFVPTEDVVSIAKNEKKIFKRKLYKGYILAKLILDNDVYWALRNIPGVSGFLGGKKPAPVSEKEVREVVKLVEAKALQKPQPAVMYEKDERVRIISGPFENFVGTVEEVYPDKGSLKVNVAIFGRPTPVELDFLQVEKI